MEKTYTVFAVKSVQPWDEWAGSIPLIYEKLKQGEATFGWSYFDGADLKKIKEKIENRDALDDKEKDVWRHAWFMLEEVKVGDYFIYINMPEYGKCTLVKITGDYTFSEPWCELDDDFRHLRPCEFIATFDRNSSIVPPFLKRRLSLQGAWWRIYAYEEFEELLDALKTGKEGKEPKERLKEKIDDELNDIVQKIYKTFPAKTLEDFLIEVFKKMPEVKEARKGPDRNGADLEIEFERGLEIDGLRKTERCAVQVKSYEGKMGYAQAIDDIKRAFESNEDYSCGLIVATALEMTPEFEKKLQDLRKEKGKDIGILLGKDLARMVIKYGIEN